MKNSTTTLVQTAVLGALVVIFDYTLKYSGLKIPFPPFPTLKFDFTGIPIVLSLLLLGLKSGATTSIVALLAILARSGDVVGASMKALAEFSTVLGMALGVVLFKKSTTLRKPVSYTLGCLSRMLVMVLANLVVLPLYYERPFFAAVVMIPYIAAFNLVQGVLTVFGGYLIYEALIRRVPTLAPQEAH